MKMIFHDDETKDFDLTFLLQELLAIENDVRQFGMDEDRKPRNNRVRHEVWEMVVTKTVSVSGHFDTLQ